MAWDGAGSHFGNKADESDRLQEINDQETILSKVGGVPPLFIHFTSDG